MGKGGGGQGWGVGTETVAHTEKVLTFPSSRLAMSEKGHSGYWSLLDALQISNSAQRQGWSVRKMPDTKALNSGLLIYV